MKSWLKLGSLAVTLSLLAACSSGLQTSPGIQEPELSAQADGHIWKRVLASTDDAEEILSTGVMRLDSVDLDLGGEASGRAAVGVRFAEFNIPKGAQIQSAHLFFVPRDSQSGTALMTLQTHSHYASKTFNTSSQNISSRYVDPPSVSWSVPAWNTNMTLQSPEIKSPDLKSIVQPLVNSSDITALTFIIKGSGHRVAKSFDSGTGGVPALEIFYTPQKSPPSTSCKQGRTVETHGSGAGVTVSGLSSTQAAILTGKNRANQPLVVKDNKSNSCVSGGTLTIVTNNGDDSSWENVFHNARRAVSLYNSQAAHIERVAVTLAGDGLNLISNTKGVTNPQHIENWTLSDSYFRHTGDDFVDNDIRATGTIDDVLVDWTYMGVACVGYALGEERAPGTMTVRDTLLALKKQKYGYEDGTNNGRGSYAFPFKWEKENQCKLALENVTIYLGPKTDGRGNPDYSPVFRSGINPEEFVTKCTNVTLLVDGNSYPSEYIKQLAGLKKRFGDGCFEIKTGSEARSIWLTQRQKWFERHSGSGYEHIQEYKNNEPKGYNP